MLNQLIEWIGEDMNTLVLFSWVIFLPIGFMSIDSERNPERYKHK